MRKVTSSSPRTNRKPSRTRLVEAVIPMASEEERELEKRAAAMGMSAEELASKIVHEYVTGRLVEIG